MEQFPSPNDDKRYTLYSNHNVPEAALLPKPQKPAAEGPGGDLDDSEKDEGTSSLYDSPHFYHPILVQLLAPCNEQVGWVHVGSGLDGEEELEAGEWSDKEKMVKNLRNLDEYRRRGRQYLMMLKMRGNAV
ncbi:hypothetical protein ONZ45_g11621 [Pleurotus djamor]|nr:hypothetical protein ONZ45_g11621 [Pleurotus djamor]